MTAKSRSFDRLLVDVLDADGPRSAPAGFFDAPITAALASAQRRPRVRALDGRAWPPTRWTLGNPIMRRRVGLVLVGLLVAVLAVALATVGARLLERTNRIPRPLSIESRGLLPAGPGTSLAVALPDGRLVIGGDGIGNTIAAVFDPGTRAATIVSSEPGVFVRDMGLLPGGQVAVFGEAKTPGTWTPGVWIVDPRTGTARSVLSGPPLTSDARFAVLQDGHVAFVSGRAVHVLDLATGAAVPARNLGELPNMPGDTFEATGLVDGRLLLVDTFGIADGPNAGVYLYDPATGVQQLVGRIHQDRADSPVRPARLADGRWLILAGEMTVQLCSGLGLHPVAAYVFDPASASLARIADLPQSARTATALSDGRVVVTGHWRSMDGCGPWGEASDDWIGLFDPATGITVESRNPVSGEGALPVDLARPIDVSVLLPDGTVALLGAGALDLFSPGERS